MIPYGHQYIDKKDIEAVVRVLKSPWLTQGPKIKEFEEELAKYCNAKYAVAVSSGTAALHLAYLTSGIKKGDEVITSPNTFAATTNMLLAVGAKPVFCDIRLDTYNIDEANIEKLITPKTKAIVPVHFAGQPCEMDEILKIAKKHRLIVIEDACHALGAEYKGKKIGGLNSDMTVFSFHPIKSITTGEGGAILTNDGNYHQKLLILRNHGIKKDRNGFNIMEELGFNYRMNDIQAALGISQLRKLDRFIKKRGAVKKRYEEELKTVSSVILPQEIPANLSSWHLFVIRLKKSRDGVLKSLKNNGVGAQIHYPPVYCHPYYQRNGYNEEICKNAEQFYKSALSLPLFPYLKISEQDFIINKLKNILKAI